MFDSCCVFVRLREAELELEQTHSKTDERKSKESSIRNLFNRERNIMKSNDRET